MGEKFLIKKSKKSSIRSMPTRVGVLMATSLAGEALPTLDSAGRSDGGAGLG